MILFFIFIIGGFHLPYKYSFFNLFFNGRGEVLVTLHRPPSGPWFYNTAIAIWVARIGVVESPSHVGGPWRPILLVRRFSDSPIGLLWVSWLWKRQNYCLAFQQNARISNPTNPRQKLIIPFNNLKPKTQ